MSEAPWHDYSDDELREALRPIASLTSKSEKAQQKLAPATWQYRMLEDNLHALHIASTLMDDKAQGGEEFGREELEDALLALASMISRTETAGAKFAPGTSQHTLQANRLKALRIAEAFVRAALSER